MHVLHVLYRGSDVYFLAPLIHLIEALQTGLGIGSGEEFPLFPVYHHTTFNCFSMKQRSELVLSRGRKSIAKSLSRD